MITAIIVDDEPKNVSTLGHFLAAYCPDVFVAGTAANAAEAKRLIEAVEPQVIFLDVEMPYGSGFDLLRLLPAINFEIIFVTGFDSYAVDAFRFAALDYLLKPVNIDRLVEAVARAVQKVNDKNSSRNYETLMANLDAQNAANRKIALTDKGEQYFVALSDVLYCVAEGSYTFVHTSGKTFLSSRHLKEFENLLPQELFCRIHHGHLVNKAHVVKVQKGRGGSVVMSDGKELEVAVRRKDEFLKQVSRSAKS